MKIFTISICFSSLVVAGVAIACGSSGETDSSGNTYSCGSVGQKNYPNDPAATQASVDLCNKCYSQAVTVAQCLGLPAKATCGADGISQDPTSSEATVETCASVLDSYYQCLGIPTDGGIFLGGDAGGSGEDDDTLIYIDACQISTNGPGGAASDSCSSSGSSLSVEGDSVLLTLLGAGASDVEMTFPLPAGGIVTGTTYTAPQDSGGLEQVQVDQGSFTCESSTLGDPSMPFSGAATSLSVVFSTYDVVSSVAHGTVTGTAPCYTSTTDASGNPTYTMVSTGATITVTF